MIKIKRNLKISIITLFMFALLLCGCGAKETSATPGNGESGSSATGDEALQDSQTQASGSKDGQEEGSASGAMSVEELYQKITQEVSLASPVCMDDEFIMNYYGIDASLLDEYVFSMSEDAAQAETVIVMKAKDAADIDGLVSCLQVVIDEKKTEMENYIPEQFAIVEKSEVQTTGDYVWLVISEQADAISKIIKDSIS